MWTLRNVPLTELAAHAELTLQGVDSQRLTMVLKLLVGTLRQESYRDLWLLQMVQGPVEADFQHRPVTGHLPVSWECLHGAASDSLPIGLLALRSGPDAACLLAIGPQLVPPAMPVSKKELSDWQAARWQGATELFAAFTKMLETEGVAFLQAMRTDDGDAPLLTRLGFEELARLNYLVATADSGVADGGTLLTGRLEHQLVPYLQWADQQQRLHRDPTERLIGLIDRTYEGSLYCPRFAAYRSTAQVVAGYLHHPQAEPRLWRIALDQDDREIGCILLTPYPENGCMEITYMGVIPAARGQGLASRLVVWAKEVTLQIGYTQISLAVDQNNHLAQSVYRKHGFGDFFNETVWGFATSSSALCD